MSDTPIPDALTSIAEALASTIKSGEWKGKPIVCSLVKGKHVDGQVLPPAVVIAPPAIGFGDTAEEAWSVTETEWPLLLHIARSGEPDTATEMEFTSAVLAALADDPTLGGSAAWSRPLVSDTPTPIAPPTGPPVMFRRTLRVRVTHNPE